jgi:hypothetical protein
MKENPYTGSYARVRRHLCGVMGSADREGGHWDLSLPYDVQGSRDKNT